MNFKVMGLVVAFVSSFGIAAQGVEYFSAAEFAKEAIAAKNIDEAKQNIDRCDWIDRQTVKHALEKELSLWVAQHGSVDQLEARKPWFKELLPKLVFLGGLGSVFLNFGCAFVSQHECSHYDFCAWEFAHHGFSALSSHYEQKAEQQRAMSGNHMGLVAISMVVAGVAAVFADYYQAKCNLVDQELNKFERIKILIDYCA